MHKLSLGLALASLAKGAAFNRSIAKLGQDHPAQANELLQPSFRKRANHAKVKFSHPRRNVPAKTKDEIKRAGLINSMTNWQRHQFAKDGHSKKLARVRHFAKLQRRPLVEAA